MDTQPLRRFFLGQPTQRRSLYFLSAVAFTLAIWLLGHTVFPSSWFPYNVWKAAIIGSVIGILAGWNNQGLVSGSLGTGLYVVVIWQSFYVLSTSRDYSLFTHFPRKIMVLGTMTAVLSIPSYFVGIGFRILGARFDPS
ncbi:hypothetical protein ACFR9U_04365 [Halorientalis brevis]|uniref:Uncharacterized protein n=1 Tax=Halorientalis brevis TaxID=1126241 RepID=A0ABD6C9N2_9EURY|nr:hypothetical protein [Halorientalis brevis]